MAYHGMAMPSESLLPPKNRSSPDAVAKPGGQGAAAPRRSGTLKLYLTAPGEPVFPPPVAAPAYAHFRLCRGFLDDLNRILPIRMRIQLEAEIAKGRDRGRIEGAGAATGFRWEFTAG